MLVNPGSKVQMPVLQDNSQRVKCCESASGMGKQHC